MQSIGEAPQLQVRFREGGQGCAEPWWGQEVPMEMGGKLDTLQGPYLPTEVCCTTWGSTRRGFNLPQL